jgi:hypothetical protein
MDKEYIVVGSEMVGDGQFGSKRYRVGFDNEDPVSMFSKYPVKVGDRLFGHVEEVTKGDKTYRNFKFGKRDGIPVAKVSDARAVNAVDFKVLPELEQLKAGQAELKFLIQAVGERLDRFLKAVGKEEVEELSTEDSPF